MGGLGRWGQAIQRRINRAANRFQTCLQGIAFTTQFFYLLTQFPLVLHRLGQTLQYGIHTHTELFKR